MRDTTTMIRRRDQVNMCGAMVTGTRGTGARALDMDTEFMSGKRRMKSKTHDFAEYIQIYYIS